MIEPLPVAAAPAATGPSLPQSSGEEFSVFADVLLSLAYDVALDGDTAGNDGGSTLLPGDEPSIGLPVPPELDTGPLPKLVRLREAIDLRPAMPDDDLKRRISPPMPDSPPNTPSAIRPPVEVTPPAVSVEPRAPTVHPGLDPITVETPLPVPPEPARRPDVSATPPVVAPSEPIAAPPQAPAPTSLQEPAAAPLQEPAAAPLQEPAPTSLQEPAAAPLQEPAAAPLQEPAPASPQEPAPPAAPAEAPPPPRRPRAPTRPPQRPDHVHEVAPRPARRPRHEPGPTRPSDSPDAGDRIARPGGPPAGVDGTESTNSTRPVRPIVDRLVERIEMWVRRSENMPPPRVMTLRGPDMEGLMIRVAMQSDGLSIVIHNSTSHDVAWLRQLGDQLTERGFDLTELTEQDEHGHRRPIWDDDPTRHRRRERFRMQREEEEGR